MEEQVSLYRSVLETDDRDEALKTLDPDSISVFVDDYYTEMVYEFAIVAREIVKQGVQKVLGCYCESLFEEDCSLGLKKVSDRAFERKLNETYDENMLEIVFLKEGKKFAKAMLNVLAEEFSEY